MFLSTPLEPGPYDLNFRVWGIPVRIIPWFWLAALLLGWNNVHIADQLELNRVAVLSLWVAAVLISILVHEMGHSLLFRLYGLRSQIVLYHFGGLAIPLGDDWGRRHWNRGRWHRVLISAAGPLAQLLLAGCVIALMIGFMGANVLLLGGRWLDGGAAESMTNLLSLFVFFVSEVSIVWALFNLLPVFPLDGGQIAREIIGMLDRRGGYQKSLVLSFVVAVGMAVWCYTGGNIFTAMLFVSLAIGNYQELQGGYGRGSW